MNEIQQKVWDYLVTGGSRTERLLALKKLSQENFFAPSDSADRSKTRITAFIESNSIGACAEGVRRFRNAVLPVQKKVIMTIEVPIEAPGLNLGGSTDGGAVRDIVDLISHKSFGRAKLGRAAFTKYEVVDA